MGVESKTTRIESTTNVVITRDNGASTTKKIITKTEAPITTISTNKSKAGERSRTRPRSSSVTSLTSTLSSLNMDFPDSLAPQASAFTNVAGVPSGQPDTDGFEFVARTLSPWLSEARRQTSFQRVASPLTTPHIPRTRTASSIPGAPLLHSPENEFTGRRSGGTRDSVSSMRRPPSVASPTRFPQASSAPTFANHHAPHNSPLRRSVIFNGPFPPDMDPAPPPASRTRRACKYYVITSGRKLGIFNDWNAVARRVNGYPEFAQRGYHSWEEATQAWEAYLHNLY